MAQDSRRQRPGVRRGRHPRRHSRRQADDRERGAGAVRKRHHADHQQPDLGRRRQESLSRASRPGSASTATRFLRNAGYDEAAIGSCARPARWPDRGNREMPSYRLHYFPESGNSYKLALMLTLCGQSFEPVWTDFGGGVTRTPEWRRDVNEMGEIPVLEVGRRAADPDRADPAASSPSNMAGSAARMRKRSSRCCAGCSGTTTS